MTSRAAIFYVYDGSRPRTSGGDGLSKGAQRATEGSSESEGRTATSGNVTVLVDAADGSVVAHYDYSPFGMTVLADGPAAAANPWRFSTKYHDTETSLVCYGYPYYSPKLARWVNRDPIGERGGSLGLARFVRNNPCGKLDLLGLFCGDCCPPAPGRPNRYNEQIMGIVRTPYGGAPWASDDLLDAVSNYTVLSDAIGFGQDLTEAALEGFTALITFLATREITDNDVADFIPDYGTFTSEAKEAIREAMSDLRDMIEANAYSIYLEVSYESCDPCAVGTILGPLTGYEMRSHTAYHKCVNASGLEVFGPSTGEIFTGADLQSCISGWESSRSLPSFSYWTPEY